MDANALRELETKELQDKLNGWQKEYFHARCKKAIGQLQNTNELRALRRTIARGKTILVEKQNPKPTA